MILVCENCGGLFTTVEGESFAGKPCKCEMKFYSLNQVLAKRYKEIREKKQIVTTPTQQGRG